MEESKEFIPEGFNKIEEQEEVFTWRKLKEQLNTIDEKFLDEQVRWWGEEEGGRIYELFKLEEKHYLTEEGYQPESTFDKNEPLEDQVDDLETYLEVGHPILSTFR